MANFCHLLYLSLIKPFGLTNVVSPGFEIHFVVVSKLRLSVPIWAPLQQNICNIYIAYKCMYIFIHLERENFPEPGIRPLSPSLLFLLPSIHLSSLPSLLYVVLLLFYIYIFIWINHLFLVHELQVLLLIAVLLC